jgi:hypothetical protein
MRIRLYNPDNGVTRNFMQPFARNFTPVVCRTSSYVRGRKQNLAGTRRVLDLRDPTHIRAAPTALAGLRRSRIDGGKRHFRRG